MKTSELVETYNGRTLNKITSGNNIVWWQVVAPDKSFFMSSEEFLAKQKLYGIKEDKTWKRS